MINFTFKGHKISIRNDDWAEMKERFNIDNVGWNGEEYEIDIPCGLCFRCQSNFNCEKCPLFVLCDEGESGYGCVNLLYKLLKQNVCLIFYKNKIKWVRQNNQKARHQLKILLRRMEKIEASQ